MEYFDSRGVRRRQKRGSEDLVAAPVGHPHVVQPVARRAGDLPSALEKGVVPQRGAEALGERGVVPPDAQHAVVERDTQALRLDLTPCRSLERWMELRSLAERVAD